jgi:hypothetical protein
MAARPTTDPVTMGNWSDYPPEQRPGYQAPGVAYSQPGNVQYSTQQFAYSATPASSTTSHAGPARAPSSSGNGGYQYAQTPANLTYTAKPVVPSAQQQPAVRHAPQQPQSPPYPPQAHPQYMATSQAQHPQQYATAQPSYPPPPPMNAQSPHPQQYSTAQPSYPPPPPMGAHPPHPSDKQRGSSHQRATSTQEGRRVVEMVPSGGGRLDTPPSPGGMRPHSLSVNGGRPDGLTNRMDRLSVSGNRPDIQTIVPGGMMGGGMPPPSPLLEAYHGTYQSISPMPGAMMMDDDLDHLSSLDSLSPRASSQSMHGGRHRAHSRSRRTPSPPHHARPKDRLALEAYGRPERSPDNRDSRDYRDSRDSRNSRDSRDNQEKEKRRVRIYDATDDALALVDAMANKTPNADPIIDILPALSHDQMLELRAEYKRHCKVQGRGINIAKHIKLKTSGNFGKIAYVTALGKYEGEGYWANYWYQSNSARRELLIEALMGRQNHEIREIKDAFKDKRYADSLVRCMDKELKADKFRKAVLMALEAERQEESDIWPQEQRNRDIETLYKAMKAREGGETAMLGVVIMRSDAHLREVLRGYERRWGTSFARDALRKSNNLVVSHPLSCS